MSNTELIAELRRGDGNGCKSANELMRRAADALEAAERDTDARERAYSAVWAGGHFFKDRGDYQTAVDNGYIWRNVERALDAILPPTTPAANKGESK